MESTVFNQKAQDYALYRPQYASEAIEALFNIVGLNFEQFEEKLRKRFDSQSKNGRITVKYTTELAVGRLNR